MSDLFGPSDAARHLVLPREDDDKYARGVVGFITGSARYPGAAVLGVEAALRTGVGMVRYLGPGRATRLVLHRRPEAVTTEGRVQAWVLGSGWDTAVDDFTTMLLGPALAAEVPIVLDAGALGRWGEVTGPAVLTPHAGELARLLGVERDEVLADREAAVRRAARETGSTVLLKGAETLVADPAGRLERVRNATPWLATAGAGDALAGILGALLATNHERPDDRVGVAATAAWIHGEAARRASDGGPFTILDLCAAVPRVVADLVATMKP